MSDQTPPQPAPLPLLCERCGYVIEGLPEEGNCPECGEAISASLPERRTFVLKWAFPFSSVAAMAQPAIFSRLRIDRIAAKRFATSACYACGGVALTGQAIVGATTLLSDDRNRSSAIVDLFVMPAGIGVNLLVGTMLLTLIEHTGIRFFSGKKGWRVTNDVAWVVCGYATVGWFVGALLSLLANAALSICVLTQTLSADSLGTYSLISTLAAMSIGLLWFETLVYIGVRRCKFANPPRA